MTRSVPAAFVAASVLAAPAAADIRTAIYNSLLSFEYEIGPVPDIDQRRVGLGVTGNNYCVPASFLNWSAYIAWHGNPGIPPGPDWYSPSVYGDVTDDMAFMGLLMLTDPPNGTSQPNALNGAQTWFGSNAFVAYFDSPSDEATTLAQMALAGINGGLVVPRVWWMQDIGNNTLTRTGGHVVSMTYAAQSGSTGQIGVADPSSDESPDNIFAQSVPTIDVYDVVYETFFLEVPVSFTEVTWPRMVGYGSDTRQGYIVGYYAIFPLVVLESQVSNLSFTFGSFNRNGPPTTTINHPALVDGDIIDAILGQSPFDVLYAVQPPRTLEQSLIYFNRATNEEFVLGPVDDFEDVASSRLNDFYVLDGRFLRCYDPDEPTGNYNTATAIVPDTTVAVTYDDLNDGVVVLNPALNELLIYDPNLPGGIQPTPFAYPGNVVVGPSPELHALPEGYLIVNPGETEAWLLTEDPASGRLLAEAVSPPGNEQPITSAAPSPAGIVFSIKGQLIDLERTPEGTWDVSPDSQFNGQPAGNGAIYAGVSRTDIDYDDAVNPTRSDTLPTQFEPREVIERCLADVNYDGFATPADFNAWIIAFNGRFQEADQNGDGLVTPADFNAWIVNYNNGC